MMARHHGWTDDQLRRMKSAVEDGVYFPVIATRFSCGVSTIQGLAAKHGWEVPGSRPISKTQATTPAKRPPAKTRHGSFFLKPNRPPFTPSESGCQVRVLQGAELEYWKGVYEARERAARARVQA